MNAETVIERTRAWIGEVVIGLNLCPFARRVFDGALIRYTVTDAATAEQLRDVLAVELQALADAPSERVETAFLIHPHALAEFRDYNDFAVEANDVLAEMGLEGVIQIATFHPRYQFAGTKPNAVENYTNRSPFPMLHLLREASVSAVNDDSGKLDDIPRRNVETLRRIGFAQVKALLARVTS